VFLSGGANTSLAGDFLQEVPNQTNSPRDSPCCVPSTGNWARGLPTARCRAASCRRRWAPSST